MPGYAAMKFDKRAVEVGLYLLLLVFSIGLSYRFFVVPVFNSQWYTLELDAVRIAEGTTLFTLTSVSSYRYRNSVAGCLLWFLFLFIIPSITVYYVLNGGSRLYVYATVGGFLLTVLAANATRVVSYSLESHYGTSLLSKLLNYDERVSFLKKYALNGVLGIVPLIVFPALFYLNGPPSLVALDLGEVYEVRGTIIYGISVITYLTAWQASVINPTLLVAGLYRRQPLVALLGAVLQMVLFLYTGHKSYLFALPLVISTYILLSERSFIVGLLKGLIAMVVGSLSLYLVAGQVLIPSILIRRFFFVPARVRRAYFMYFSQNPHIKMSGSRLGVFWSAPYEESLPAIVGSTYFGGSNANIGYLASAFADFGLLGIAVFATLAGIVLGVSDVFSEGLPIEVVVGIWIMPVFSLTTSRLSTVVLTHGLGLALLVTIFLVWKHRDRGTVVPNLK